MKLAFGFAVLAAFVSSSAGAAVVAGSLPFTNTPAWSDVTFVNTTMGVVGSETVITTVANQGVWFGWLGSQNPPAWSIGDNNAGSYLSINARFSIGSADWDAYMGDNSHAAAMMFNPTGCNPNLNNCYLFTATPGITLSFRGATAGTVRKQFIAIDTVHNNHFEWLLQGGNVTYRINGTSYTDSAMPYSGQQHLIIGDSSGSSPATIGQMRISAVSFDSAPEFSSLPSVPEPASWAMLIIGFGLIGAATRRRLALFA